MLLGMKTTALHWLNRALLAASAACLIALCSAAPSFATTVSLQWGASPSSGVTGYRVYYRPDSSSLPFSGTGATQGASPVNVGNVTSATISGLDSTHSYYFAITAYNASGGESPYSNIVSVPELSPPTAAITSPSSGATVTGTVSVAANATDNVGVTKVEFYLNGVLAATDTATPYLYSWNTSSLAAGTYTLMVKAYDAAGNVGQSGNVSVNVVNDTTAPTVSLTSPASGATLSGTATLSASASDNIGVTKVELYDNGSLLYATNVSPYSYSWNTVSTANGTHTLMAKAYDAAGNVGQSGSVTVNVQNGVTTPSAYTLWPATAVPATVDAGGDSPSELGIKFRSDVSGYITGIRFYKAGTNTGTHVGNLWSSNGTRLATATFTNESASGWQQVTFPTPVAITANTVYVASYFNQGGHYSVDRNYFTSNGMDSPPLHALASGVSGSNGVYAYGSTSVFPNLSYSNTNYWVDVLFTPTTPAATTSSTIWSTTAVPATVDAGGDSPSELGVKFRSDVSGYITGIRFYKASTNTGTHVGNLWSSNGTRLATATFTNETASGWQQVNFATPVAVTANTVYVASYFNTGGHYSVDRNYFTSKGMDSAPLHALATGVSGSDGVYAYGSTSLFPTLSYSDTNYWVDVVFKQ